MEDQRMTKEFLKDIVAVEGGGSGHEDSPGAGKSCAPYRTLDRHILWNAVNTLGPDVTASYCTSPDMEE